MNPANSFVLDWETYGRLRTDEPHWNLASNFLSFILLPPSSFPKTVTCINIYLLFSPYRVHCVYILHAPYILGRINTIGLIKQEREKQRKIPQEFHFIPYITRSLKHMLSLQQQLKTNAHTKKRVRRQITKYMDISSTNLVKSKLFQAYYLSLFLYLVFSISNRLHLKRRCKANYKSVPHDQKPNRPLAYTNTEDDATFFMENLWNTKK